jgi:hypothetical protein
MEFNKDRIIIASDVERDGIGVEVYRNEELTIEIFRNDAKQLRTINVFKENIDLSLMEDSIKAFKKEIPWEFITDEKSDK